MTVRSRCLHALFLGSLFGLAHADSPPVQTAASVRPPHAAIASANSQATDAGIEIIQAGGNAFDAAVAVSATLGLVEPESSGIGGGAFMLLHVAATDSQVFIDARERAPLAASRDMYLGADGEPKRESSVNGALAAAIPGLPAGLVHLAKNYGKLPLSVSLAPAIKLATEGWTFSGKNAVFLGFRREVLAANPAAAALFLSNGEMPKPGDRLKNPDYAAMLERLATDGEASFYQGAFAQSLVDGVRAGGGVWTMEDLATYRVVERPVLRIEHRGHQIISVPPPSSGGVALATTLNILAGYDYARMPRVARIHLLTEAMRRAYRDRALYLGDPDFVEVPVALLASSEYAAGLRAGIHPQRATPSAALPGIGDPAERPDTSHFSIIDTEGNLLAMTQTVNLPFGNGFVVPGSGFLLNNQMDDFSVKPGAPNQYGLVGDNANAIAPGKRPLSSMTPSFVIGKDRVAVIGTPGGSRIISMVLLGILDLLDGGSAEHAVALPRLHHQYLPDALSAEPGALADAEITELQAMGHTISAGERGWGNMQVVVWNKLDNTMEAGSDPRWKGVGKASTADDGVIFR
ncbi:MAG: gamma-glutamyltransferase [Pseudomarimonas sp.]